MAIILDNYFHFVATFADGSRIYQDSDDRSKIDPSKSQFFDVREYSRLESPLISFVLTDPKQSMIYGVDLRDGHFEVNGLPFFPYRADREILKDFRVIYFRNVRHDKYADTGEVVSYLGYTIGFQAKDRKGRNVQHIMKIG